MTVRTVRGPVARESLGFVQPHEHVLVDLSPPEHRGGQGEAPSPITLHDYFATRMDHTDDDRRLLSRGDAIEELTRFAAHGGTTIVDLSVHGISRDPDGLVRVAEQTGLNIVMGCGWYTESYQPAGVRDQPVDRLVAELLAEVHEGVGETGVRPGIIGEIGMSYPAGRSESRVLQAAAIVQRETGLSLNVHPGRDPAAPADHVRTVLAHGAAADRVVVSHIDRTLFTLDAMLALADEGVYLEFDLFGQESSYYSLADIDMPNDAARLVHLRRLIEHGHLERLLISQDICHKTNLRKYGGEGYTHILDRVVPLMRRRGFTDAEIDQITVRNPARVLDVP